MEVQKKADFSGSFLVTGETGRWPGNHWRTRQYSRRQGAQGDQVSRWWGQGSKGERSGEAAATEGQGEGYGKVCVRDR